MTQRPLPFSTDRVVLFVLAVMGAVSLVYQVTWTRQLTTLLGSTVSAVALITAMFMLGMALGAWLMGARSDGPGRPLRTLALLTGGLGVTGLIAIPLYDLASRVYVSGFLGTSRLSLLVLGAVLAGAMTLVPTALVGAGFPVASRILSIHRRDIASGVGSAYVAGTIGSVTGALAAGFALVPGLGVNMTIMAVAALSAAAGVALLLMNGRIPEDVEALAPTTEPDQGQSADRHSDDHLTRRPALVAFVLSGASIMIYETVWARELLLVFGASVYAVATMLAAVLSGLAIGQWLGSRNAQGRHGALGTIGLLQLAGAGAALLSLPLTRAVPFAYFVARAVIPGNLATFAATQFALTFVVVAAPCVLLGATAPIATRLATSTRTFLGKDIGLAYALNTFGAVVGSLIGGLVLMPLFSTAGTAIAAAALNTTAGMIALRRVMALDVVRRARLAQAAMLLAAGAASLLFVNSASPLLNLAVGRAHHSGDIRQLLESVRMMNVVYAKDAPQGRVAVYEDPVGARSLYASGMNEGAHGFQDMQTMELIVRIPVASHGEIGSALVVGLGTGTTSLLTLSAPGEPVVDTVEINPAVVEASRYFIDTILETHPRSNIILDDARHHYTTTDMRYDLIASEPSYPLSTYSARMFTRESLEAAYRILKPDGVMLQWLPAYLMDEEDLLMMTKTFGEVFPQSHVWVTYVPGTTNRVDYMLVGVHGDFEFDPPAVRESILESGGDIYEFEHIMGPDEITELVEDPSIPSNTDDRPIFEYRAPLRYLRAVWD